MSAPQAGLTSEDFRKMVGGDWSQGGGTVSTRDAMRNAAINRCVNLISGSIGQLPLQLMISDPSGSGGIRAKDHPLYRVLARRPNNWQSPSKFKRLMQYRALTEGNAYALPIRVGNRVTELIPLATSSGSASGGQGMPIGQMRVEQESDWSVVYIYQGRGGERRFKSSEIFHIMGPSDNGLSGLSLRDVARDTLNLARQSDASMLSMMARGIRPGGMLTTEKTLSPEAFARLKDDFLEQNEGATNAGKWLIGEQGLTATPFVMNGRDSQNVEFRNQLVEEVARFFGIPRPLLMMDDTSWGSGIEQLAIFYSVHCLGPWFNVWEEEIILKLLSEKEQEIYYPKFNERALLRGSMQDQGEFIAKLLGAGGSPQTIEQNEARHLLDYPPHPDGFGLHSGFAVTGVNQ